MSGLVSDRLPRERSRTTRQRLLRLLRAAPPGRLRRRSGKVTLAELEDSGRPLLFSLLPRMLRGDGSAPGSLQATFGYVGDDGDEPAAPVSDQRWSRALATSRRLASRRLARAAAAVEPDRGRLD